MADRGYQTVKGKEVARMTILKHASHRPFPLPEGPWVMKQTWRNVLFAHWPVSPAAIRALVPEALQLDTYDGGAWVSAVALRMSGIRLRWLPPVPFASSFAQLNVRTYVTVDGKPGVFFFSLDAANPLAVWMAGRWLRLPYFHAQINVRAAGRHTAYALRRTHPNAPAAEFAAQYRPVSDVSAAQPGTLAHWLTERYCLYAIGKKGQICRGDLHHLPLPLQRAEAEISTNTMALAHDIRLPDVEPVLHYAHRVETVIWPLRSVGG